MSFRASLSVLLGCQFRQAHQLLASAAAGEHAKVQQVLQAKPQLAAFAGFHGTTSPLHRAAAAGHLDTCKAIVELIKMKAIAADQDAAAKKSRSSSGKRWRSLLNKVLNQRSHLGQTALMLACQNGYTEITAYLLAAGADPMQVDMIHARNALHYAAIGGHVGCVKVLCSDTTTLLVNGTPRPLRDIVSVDLQVQTSKFVDQRSYGGLTALHFAAVSGSLEVMQILLRSGASIMVKTDGEAFIGSEYLTPGSTPLHIAVLIDSMPLAHLLIQSHAEIMTITGVGRDERRRRAWEGHSRSDVRSMRNSARKLPYHLARERGWAQMMQLVDPRVSVDTALDAARDTDHGLGPKKLGTICSMVLQQSLLQWLDTHEIELKTELSSELSGESRCRSASGGGSSGKLQLSSTTPTTTSDTTTTTSSSDTSAVPSVASSSSSSSLEQQQQQQQIQYRQHLSSSPFATPPPPESLALLHHHHHSGDEGLEDDEMMAWTSSHHRQLSTAASAPGTPHQQQRYLTDMASTTSAASGGAVVPLIPRSAPAVSFLSVQTYETLHTYFGNMLSSSRRASSSHSLRGGGGGGGGSSSNSNNSTFHHRRRNSSSVLVGDAPITAAGGGSTAATGSADVSVRSNNISRRAVMPRARSSGNLIRAGNSSIVDVAGIADGLISLTVSSSSTSSGTTTTATVAAAVPSDEITTATTATIRSELVDSPLVLPPHDDVFSSSSSATFHDRIKTPRKEDEEEEEAQQQQQQQQQCLGSAADSQKCRSTTCSATTSTAGGHFDSCDDCKSTHACESCSSSDDMMHSDAVCGGGGGGGGTAREEAECGVCLDSGVEVAFAGCEHALCLQCARNLTKQDKKPPPCPFCRRMVVGFLKLPSTSVSVQ